MMVKLLTPNGLLPAEQPEIFETLNIEDITRVLSSIRTPVIDDEYKLQTIISGCLEDAGIPFEREYRLGPRNRIDFLLPAGIGIEVKKGKPARTLVVKQLERYTRFDRIQSIIFVIERSLDIPGELNGKRCICFPLNRLWGVALP